MNERFALAVVDKFEYAVLSVTLLDHTPYCVPISIVRIDDAVPLRRGWEEDRRTQAKSARLRCLRRGYSPHGE